MRTPTRQFFVSLGRIVCGVCGFALLLLGAIAVSPRLNRLGFAQDPFAGVSNLLVVFAHADDEVTNAGFLRAASLRGVKVTLVTLTDGGANPSSNLGACEEPDIIACRRRELECSARILGVHRLVTPALPDSHLVRHMDEAAEVVGAELRTLRPELVLTMEPSGLNGLTDHRAAHAITARALARHTASPRPTVLLSTLPLPISLFLRTVMPPDSPFPVRSFPLDPALTARKVEAAACHASQASTINGLTAGLGPAALFRWMDSEAYYVIPDAAIPVTATPEETSL